MGLHRYLHHGCLAASPSMEFRTLGGTVPSLAIEVATARTMYQQG